MIKFVSQTTLQTLPLCDGKHCPANSAATLPPAHSDPFDRMLIAQALEERLLLVPADAKIARYGVDILATWPSFELPASVPAGTLGT